MTEIHELKLEHGKNYEVFCKKSHTMRIETAHKNTAKCFRTKQDVFYLGEHLYTSDGEPSPFDNGHPLILCERYEFLEQTP